MLPLAADSEAGIITVLVTVVDEVVAFVGVASIVRNLFFDFASSRLYSDSAKHAALGFTQDVHLVAATLIVPTPLPPAFSPFNPLQGRISLVGATNTRLSKVGASLERSGSCCPENLL